MTPKEHLQLTFKLWHSTISELESMQDFFTVQKINNQFYRRAFIRNVFSIIETYLYVTKELIKNKLIIDKTSEITWADLAILNEKKAFLDTQGKVNIKDDFQKFEPSLKFTLNTFANIFDSVLPNYGDSNFEKLKKLSKRRNDITHPKSLENLNVSDQEIEDTISMFSWFIKTHSTINSKFLEWINIIYSK